MVIMSRPDPPFEFVQTVLVDKILREGFRPSDFPVEQPTKLQYFINLRVTKALGLDVPLHLQQLADEVVE